MQRNTDYKKRKFNRESCSWPAVQDAFGGSSLKGAESR
jgi:hypothetical protein